MQLPTGIQHLCTAISISSLVTSAVAAPQLLGGLLCSLVGNCRPPLAVTISSPECVNVNQGSYVCCGSEVIGDNAIVQALAATVDYTVTPDSISGLLCQKSPTCDAIKMCCEVDAFVSALGLGLYCQVVS